MQKMKLIIYRAVGALSVICFLAFVVAGIAISIINQNQILFEVWYGNPWPGSEPRGIYMDAEGNIFNFRVKEEGLNRWITDINKPPYFAFDLYRKYAFSGQKIGTVDKKTLDEMLRLIQPASAGVQLEFQKTEWFLLARFHMMKKHICIHLSFFMQLVITPIKTPPMKVQFLSTG
jgi:hypothetical protein